MAMSGTIQAGELLKKVIGCSLPADVSDFAVKGITADSRDVQNDFIFVAVAGTQVDGANFASAAAARGARLVISHRPIDGVSNIVVVPKTNEVLARLAWAYYGIDDLQAAGKLKIYGVTGTNGKTTFCYLFQYFANQLGRRCARFGTVEYDLLTRKVEASRTTPDTMTLAKLLREAVDNGADSLVMEVSSHALEQGRAAGLIFSGGAFTNLTGDHLDYHKTMENYLAAKLILFQSMSAGSTAVVNADDPVADQVLAASRCRQITFGIDNPKATLVATNLKMEASGTSGKISFEGRTFDFHSPFIGRHNVSNVLTAVGMGLGAGFDLEKMVSLIPNLPTVPGRLQRVPTDGRGFEVFVDYAHTDDGLVNVTSSLKPLVKNKLIVVFGCGGDRDRTKRPRMAKVAEKYGDVVIVTNDNPRTEKESQIFDDIMAGFSSEFKPMVHLLPDRTQAIGQAIGLAQPGDIVLIAGKGHETYQIIGKNTIHFDDCEKAREAIAKKTK
jgi:UDP-N-acetylmuramoyl-L-alanyl-D-glutamate--2,6-diaminopimelate ligase